MRDRRRVQATPALSALIALLGTVLIVETALVGGGVGYVLGAVLVLAGSLRLYLSSR